MALKIQKICDKILTLPITMLAPTELQKIRQKGYDSYQFEILVDDEVISFFTYLKSQVKENKCKSMYETFQKWNGIKKT